MTIEKRQNVSIVLNALVVCFVIYSSIFNLIEDGWGFFQYYTELSNLFGGITSAICLYHFIARKRGKIDKIPDWCTEFKFYAVCCLMLTFLVVVTVLAPEKGGWYGYRTMLFGKTSICTHFLTPLTITASFIFFDTENIKKSPFRAIIPTLLYAVVAIILNVARLLRGPYFFLHVYEQPIYMTLVWTVVILGINALIVLVVSKLKKHFMPKTVQ